MRASFPVRSCVCVRVSECERIEWKPKYQADSNMKQLLAELDAENAAAQSKSSKSSRKKSKKKGLPDAPRVRTR